VYPGMIEPWDEHSETVAAVQQPAIPLPWLTYEVALYGLITVAGLVVRLAALGQWPLGEVGVNTALAAWRTVQGSSWRPAFYSPLLYDADLLLFALTRATDAAARLLPALAGAGLVFLPYLARDALGRKGALAASLLLALAPSWVFFSRAADSAILTASASALLLVAAQRTAHGKAPGALRWCVVALALGLTAGPGIYTTLLAMALFVLFWAWRHRGDDLPDVPIGLHTLRSLALAATQREALLLFLGTFALLASGFLANPGGIGASVNLAGYWGQTLVPGAIDLYWWSALRNLAAYEFMTIALAVAGIAWGLRRGEPFTVFLMIWAGLALLLGTLMGHREPSWMLDALLPLVLLAARGVEGLCDRLLAGADRVEGLVVLLAIPLLAFSALELLAYVQTGQESALDYARISWGLLIIAWVGYLLRGERGAALRVGAVLAGLLMVGSTVRLTTAVAWQTGSDAREWLAYRPASVQLHDLEALVTDLSSRFSGDPHTLDIDYERALDPWMGWALRDFPRARAVPSITAQPEATLLVTGPRAREEWPQGYAGQSFRLRETGPSGAWTGRELLRWLLYREAVGAVQAEEVQVWIKLPAGK